MVGEAEACLIQYDCDRPHVASEQLSVANSKWADAL